MQELDQDCRMNSLNQKGRTVDNENQTNGKSIAALTLGILSILITFIGLIIGIIGVIL